MAETTEPVEQRITLRDAKPADHGRVNEGCAGDGEHQCLECGELYACEDPAVIVDNETTGVVLDYCSWECALESVRRIYERSELDVASQDLKGNETCRAVEARLREVLPELIDPLMADPAVVRYHQASHSYGTPVPEAEQPRRAAFATLDRMLGQIGGWPPSYGIKPPWE